MELDELVGRARNALSPRSLSPRAEAGGVAAAILTEAGNVYVGVCIDTACSMGFCAEHAAAAAMITAGEQNIEKLVAVGRDGRILPPCGRCREFLSQLDENNADARVLVREGTELLLRDLLPYDWKQFKDET